MEVGWDEPQQRQDGGRLSRWRPSVIKVRDKGSVMRLVVEIGRGDPFKTHLGAKLGTL